MTAPFVKPVRVARFGGTSAAETANSTEPASGEKDTGWLVDDEPPSSYFNWLHYRAYKWFRWLNERMFDVTGGTGLKIATPVVDTAADDGGELQLAGADSGANADRSGGDVVITGGDATGTGSSDVTIKAATRGAAGVGARAKEDYIKCDGDVLSGPTTRGRVIISKPTIISGLGDANGLEVGSVDGHSLSLTGDVTDPISSLLAITPQAPDPTGVANGDVYVNSASDQIAHRGANRWQNLDTIVKTLSGIVTIQDTVGATEANFTGAFHPIPADTLRAGTVIKVRAWGEFVAAASDAWAVRIRLDNTSVGLLSRNVTALHFGENANASQKWILEAEILIKSIGVSGDAHWKGEGHSNRSTFATPIQTYEIGEDLGLDTESEITVSATYDFATGSQGNDLDLYGFVVEVL
jgi:hypothetical protein